MAVSFNNDTTQRADSLHRDWPENISIGEPELNGRHEHTDVSSLAADIAAHGQHTPCVCRKNDDGQPTLVTGHRRWRAIVLLNEQRPDNRIPVIFRYQALDDAEAFSLTISENRFRKDVSEIDDAENLRVLTQKFGKNLVDCAILYFPEAGTEAEKKEAIAWVKQRLALVELAPEAAQAVRNKRIKITAAVALSRMSKEQQRKVIKESEGEKRIKVKTVVPKKDAPLSQPITEIVNKGIWLAQEVLDESGVDWKQIQDAARLLLHNAKKAGFTVKQV